jgi:hypothetical protein
MSDGIYGEPAKPFARCTKDTELAFLQALRLTGQAKKAAHEIGRSPNSAYTYRKRHPEFARRWDETIAAQQRDWIAAHQARLAAVKGSALDILAGDAANGGGRLTAARERVDGWSAMKRGIFLRALKRTKSVKEACAAARVAASSAYRLKSKSVRFAAAWERHLAETKPPSVLAAAVARAVDGWDEPIVQGGKVVAFRKRYSDLLMRDLLRAERGEDEKWDPARDKRGWNAKNQHRYASKEQTDASLNNALDRMAERIRAREAREQAEQWEEWKASWAGTGGPSRRFDAEEEAVA